MQIKQEKHSYDDLILNNKKWVAAQLKQDPDYFNNLLKRQKPPFLYIGCSDSRKPINIFTQTGPGEIFIQRNIANQVSLTDMNLLSMLEYGVEVLNIEHLIVCGHHGCSGVEAAMSDNVSGLVENWVSPIRDIYLTHQQELDQIKSKQKRIDRLAEMNVIAQAKNLCKTSVVKKAFRNNKHPKIYGWMFHMKSGLIYDLPLPINDWKKEDILPDNYKN